MSQPPGNCPVCQKPLLKGEDIVTCPSCGARYHRACYQQAGDCVFSAQHGNGFEYQPPQPKGEAAPKNEGGVLCPHCKTVNDARNIFCENCGQPLHAQTAGQGAQAGAPPPPQYGPFNPFTGGQGRAGAGWGYGPQRQYSGTIEGIPANEWAEFVGSSAPVYLARLSSMERNKSKVSFMFSAFFVSPMYFAYRKMWFWAAISLLGTILFYLPTLLLASASGGLAVPFGLSAATLETVAIVANYLDLGMRLLFGMFGMLLFRRFAAKKMGAIRQQAADDGAYHDTLIRKGGTSIPGVLVAFGIIFVFVSIAYWLMGDVLIEYMNSLLFGA